MSRNKLSPHDRIKNTLGKAEKLIEEYCKSNNIEPLHKHISTIRSKALKQLIIFNLLVLEKGNYNVLVNFSPKEISSAIGIGERTIYDLIKVSAVLGAISSNQYREIGI